LILMGISFNSTLGPISYKSPYEMPSVLHP
jgi:hypothetical protein